MVWAPVAVAFTAFAVGGVANAFNIIDGFNGLAAGTAMIVLAAMGLVGLHLGDTQLNSVCVVLAATATGFLFVNWPFGKLFLGDGGAYFLGFSVAWVAVLLLERHAEVSAWCPLLICAYPVLEVVFSMLRRRTRRSNVMHPDRLHLHSLVKRRIVRQLFPSTHRTLRNSITGALLWGMTLLPALWAVPFFDNTPMLAIGMLFFGVTYQALYVRLVWFGWKRLWRRHHLTVAPSSRS
jgi:UDP-N-acetylmuramyl pentapeptide phosphotransferase/UDP-N-acetylglucosamine-1-phosphate transferase